MPNVQRMFQFLAPHAGRAYQKVRAISKTCRGASNGHHFVVRHGANADFLLKTNRLSGQERGMSRQDAEDVIEKMAKYDDFFVNLMMNEELGLQVCSNHDGDCSLKRMFSATHCWAQHLELREPRNRHDLFSECCVALEWKEAPVHLCT